ncbi:hypothetical protein BG844_17620 [Couchioplanes caeruleus subsp. caeruleus]|uniref:ABC transporter domain-containing protein n=1 Tax=Couchioplanes caeruleus subsp. caeruleus TaxID=56427 RepID=A0A1K0FJT0_9ACTN|nr:hypothetical protein BG844_17620 [Couchioplanes caeruleus subsp. caeruleus]
MRDIDLDINGGDFVGVIGSNGAGKSTMLSLCAGLTRPTEGSVIRGRMVPYIGWCPQRDLVDWSLTVRQNILLPLAVLGVTGAQARSRAAEVMELLDLKGVASRQVELLSGGQLRRVQVARAIATRASVLILDEPASGLDPEGTDRVYRYLAELTRKSRTAVLISSHDLGALETVANRVVEISEGRCVYDGHTAEYVSQIDIAPTTVIATVSEHAVDQVVASIAKIDGAPCPSQEGRIVSIPIFSARMLPAVLGALTASEHLESLTVEKAGLRDAYLATRGQSGDLT